MTSPSFKLGKLGSEKDGKNFIGNNNPTTPFSTNRNLFLLYGRDEFDFKCYKAKRGLAIGGFASPTLADFVITDSMNEALENISYDPVLITTSIYDTILIDPKDKMYNLIQQHQRAV